MSVLRCHLAHCLRQCKNYACMQGMFERVYTKEGINCRMQLSSVNRHLIMRKVLCFHHELSYPYRKPRAIESTSTCYGGDRKMKSCSGKVNMLNELWESSDEK